MDEVFLAWFDNDLDFEDAGLFLVGIYTDHDLAVTDAKAFASERKAEHPEEAGGFWWVDEEQVNQRRIP